MKRGKSVAKILKAYDNAGFFTVITCENGKRAFTYGGLDALAAFEFIREQLLINRQVYIFPDSYLGADDCQSDETFFIEATKRLKGSAD